MIAGWILDQLFYWWLVSYLLAAFYWHRQGDEVVSCMIGSIFTSPMILAVIVLLLEVGDFVYNRIPASAHSYLASISSGLLRLI